MLISFVVPCYKSAKTIEKVVSDINALVKTRKGYEAEIILVNDKSPDNTWEVITDLVKKNKNIVGIDLAKNSGQQCALMAGFKQAKGEIILASDDDGQTPVDTAYSLIDKLIDENFDVVCAKYVDRGKRSLFRRIGTWADRKMVKVFLEKPDEFTTSIYFAARKFIIDEIIKYDNPYPYWTGLLLRTTHNIGNVEVVQNERLEGKSGYNLSKLLGLWINGCTSFSIKPVRFATFLGGLMAFFGVIATIVLLIRKFTNPGMQSGWTSLIVAIVFIGGLLMFMLGVIGEYIGRIYLSINQSPQYVIREIIENENAKRRNKDD